jgi:atypical dual specificity phosphatase
VTPCGWAPARRPCRRRTAITHSAATDRRRAGVPVPAGALRTQPVAHSLTLDDAFAMLHDLGLRAIVSLTEQPLPDAALTRHGLAAVHLPVRDCTPPSVAQIEPAITAIDGWLTRGMPAAVHCAAGLGRTGTILACYLARQGENPETAIANVRARRPGSIETPEQEAAIAAHVRHLR